MKLIKKVFLANTAIIFGVTGFICYMHPAVLKNPGLFWNGYRRGMREIYAGLRIGLSYKWNLNNITPELHKRNS